MLCQSDPNIFANGFEAIQRRQDDAEIWNWSSPTTRTMSPSGSLSALPDGIIGVMEIELNVDASKEK